MRLCGHVVQCDINAKCSQRLSSRWGFERLFISTVHCSKSVIFLMARIDLQYLLENFIAQMRAVVDVAKHDFSREIAIVVSSNAHT